MHQVLAVLSHEKYDYEDQMEQYMEYEQGYELKSHHEFYNIMADCEVEYYTSQITGVKLLDGRILDPDSREFTVVMPCNIPLSEYKGVNPQDKDVKTGRFVGGKWLRRGETTEQRIPEGLEKKKYPMKDMFSTVEEAIENYFGYKKDERANAYGYWHNPDGRYDWFVLGGRWKGMLLVKEDCDSLIGQEGAFGPDEDAIKAPDGYAWVDTARIKDIEFGLMIELKTKKAIENLMKYNDLSEKDRTTTVKMKFSIRDNESDEDYIKRMSKPIVAAGVIDTDGDLDEFTGWYSDEDVYNDYILKENPNHYLSMVDCHS